MSAGHGHSRPNLKHPQELRKLLQTGGAPELMQRWKDLDVDHDIPYLAGYNVGGTTRYLDRDFLHALLDPRFAEHVGIGQIDTGLSAEDTVECLLEHEGAEKVILDADNQIDVYEPAHELATTAEHQKVIAKGGQPHRYERGLKKAIEFCAKKRLHQVPPDYACAPALDEHDERVLKQLQALGVKDAFKAAKADVDYSSSTGRDQCAGCAHWEQGRGEELSTCEEVDGLVRNTYWCRKYEASDGEADERDSQQPAEQQLRDAGYPQVPDAGPEPRGKRQGPGNAAGKEGADFAQYGREDQGQGEPQAG